VARILVVDDEAIVGMVLTRTLERAGYEVVSFLSSTEALREFEPGKFDLVFCDLNMPGIDGAHMAVELSKIDPAVPIVMMSGAATDSRESPTGRMLPKPFSPITVLAIVKEYLR
jgi:CheY-like chemotaxis protein